jgi:hypothetical protein
MSIDYEDATILEIMVVRSLQNKALDFDPPWTRHSPEIPSIEEIREKLDAPSGENLGEFAGHLWEAVDEWVYDNFPQFRYEED